MWRFERAGSSFGQWLEGLGAWTLFQSGATSTVPPLRLFAAPQPARPAAAVAPQPSPDDSPVAPPPGMTAEAPAADAPIIWPLPENETPSGPLTPLAIGGADDSSAAATLASPSHPF